VAKSYLFHALGLALSEKQMPRFVGDIDSHMHWMELLEPEAALRRQALYPTGLEPPPDPSQKGTLTRGGIGIG